MSRVAVACVFHESNTLVPTTTPLAGFEPWLEGEAVLRMAGTQTATGGFLDGLAHEGLDATGVLYAWATPSGVVEGDAFRAIGDRLTAALAVAAPVDGLLLELHGAMVAEGGVDADAELAALARRAVGHVPIVAVLDPHANLSPRLADEVDAVLAYQTNPHVDMAARGRRAASLLATLLERGARATTHIVRVPVIAPAIAQATHEPPLDELTAFAARTELTEPEVLAASIFFGYAYADVPELGMHVAVVAEQSDRARTVAEDLATACWSLRERFARELLGIAEAMRIARESDGLTVLADTGDNVGGGARGNSTALLAAALAVPGLRVATTICDPAAVANAIEAGTGSIIDIRLGAPPLEVKAFVEWTGSGRYVNRGPLSAGALFDMGDVARLRIGDAQVVAQTTAVMANDQNMLACAGVDLNGLDAVILKGAVAVRAGWVDRAARFVSVATAGDTPSHLDSGAYSRARRPLWPFDAFAWRNARPERKATS